jgi:hypothetical protein
VLIPFIEIRIFALFDIFYVLWGKGWTAYVLTGVNAYAVPVLPYLIGTFMNRRKSNKEF